MANNIRQLKIKNYKCFGENPQGFDEIRPISLIIGRNNSGKSSLLDLMEYALLPYDISALGRKGRLPEVLFTRLMSQNDIEHSFRRQKSGGHIPGNHFEFGSKWIGQPITYSRHWSNSGSNAVIEVSPSLPDNPNIIERFRRIAIREHMAFENKLFKRLRSDRDITSEVESSTFAIGENGQHSTNAIRQYLTKASLDSSLIEEKILGELNEIFQPDSSFTGIEVKQLDNGPWEIFLSEGSKGRIALSQSGSGIKTILLVLIYLYLIPNVEKRDLSNFVFGFEELENNLHPSLQRRLFAYLRDIAIKEGCTLLITTHSNVVIDLFSSDDDIQILHVIHDGESAQVNTVNSYLQRIEILDDLGVRASDLLQANGVIWVEGPSDRVYFNKWIELWSGGKYKEGFHYQCAFYGGSILAHLTANDPEIETKQDLLNILKVNRNAILLMDSDTSESTEELGASKVRMISEIDAIGGFSWVTEGKEVENYLPVEVFQNHYEVENISDIGQYQKISEYLDAIKDGEGKRFKRDKVSYARQFTTYLDKENLSKQLDLADKITQVCSRIEGWNS
ncbi:MAG: AAA family ATPase [Chloroflexi bacterium]|nr:AAA family ATPase [Chloroflexota bacterium]